jgi:hypothetical protein
LGINADPHLCFNSYTLISVEIRRTLACFAGNPRYDSPLTMLFPIPHITADLPDPGGPCNRVLPNAGMMGSSNNCTGGNDSRTDTH